MPGNPNQLWGQTQIAVDGLVVQTAGKGSLMVGGPVRTPVEGDNVAGLFTVETKPSEVECEVLVGPGTSLVALQAIDNATIVHSLDTGQIYIVRKAFVSDAISASEGKAKVKFNGPPAQELLS